MSSRPEATAGTVMAPRSGPDPLAVLTTGVLLLVAGAVVMIVLLAATGADSPSTLADPGPATTTGLPLARYLQDVLGVLVVGAALVGALSSGGQARALRALALRLLGPLATAWGAVTVVVYLLTASDLSGRALPRVLDAQVQGAFLTLPQARAQLLVLLAAAVLVVASQLRRQVGPTVARVLLVVATAGLLPPAFVGHSAAAEDHGLAVASVSVHLVAGALWVGGLAVLAVLVLADHRVPVADAMPTLRSFSTLALVCVGVLAASGVLNGSLRVDGLDQLTGSGYGLVLVAKAAMLAVLVLFGWWHRRRSLVELGETGRRSAFVRLVVLELVVMVLTVAAAVVLARTPPPGV